MFCSCTIIEMEENSKMMWQLLKQHFLAAALATALVSFNVARCDELKHMPQPLAATFASDEVTTVGEELQAKPLQAPARKQEAAKESSARITEMEKVADYALVPPVLNTSPLPDYDYEQLNYGMTIGIERTPGGRLWACWVAGGDSPAAYFVLATSDDDGQTWSKPRLVVDSHSKDLPRERSILVGNLWTDPLGRLWLIFEQSMDMFDGRAGVWATLCENPDADVPTWSATRRIWHGVTLNKPTVLSTVEWMLPISLDQRGGAGRSRVASPNSIRCEARTCLCPVMKERPGSGAAWPRFRILTGTNT
ncbi:MAG: sialidase family protein [Fuerstiella sp.]